MSLRAGAKVRAGCFDELPCLLVDVWLGYAFAVEFVRSDPGVRPAVGREVHVAGHRVEEGMEVDPEFAPVLGWHRKGVDFDGRVGEGFEIMRDGFVGVFCNVDGAVGKYPLTRCVLGNRIFVLQDEIPSLRVGEEGGKANSEKR